MTQPFKPTPAQEEIRDAEDLAMLLLAPPGCGKTEALALRAAGLVKRGLVLPPRRLLMITFTNRAKDNLEQRLRTHIPDTVLRRCVTVTNFHGFAARLVAAHKAGIGHDADWTSPESDWVSDQCQHLELGWDRSDAAKEHLQNANLEPLTDSKLLTYLEDRGATDAVAIETERQKQKQLTYADLLRLADLALCNDAIVDLYRHHFAAVMVDEFQDLTLQQLRLVQQIGRGRTTYAGDTGQAIFSFTGARPKLVLEQIQNELGPDRDINQVVLGESHRSTPAVLHVVNAMTSSIGGTTLSCADEDSWPHEGLSAVLGFSSTAEEAQWALQFAEQILASDPKASVGVMARITSRRRFFDERASASDLSCFRWDDPMLDTQAADRTRSVLLRIESRSPTRSPSLAELRNLASFEQITDPRVRTDVAGALNWAFEALSAGDSPADLRSRIRVGAKATLLEQPGIHMLTAHAGKGQQFDWVVIVGAEEGTVPFFKATSEDAIEEEARTMAVMLSRAKLGVVATWSSSVEAATSGLSYSKEPSRFLSEIRSACAFTTPREVETWLASQCVSEP